MPQLLNLLSRAHEPQLLSPRATTTEAHAPRARAPQQEKPPQWEAHHCDEEQPPLAATRESLHRATKTQHSHTHKKGNHSNTIEVYFSLTKLLFRGVLQPGGVEKWKGVENALWSHSGTQWGSGSAIFNMWLPSSLHLSPYWPMRRRKVAQYPLSWKHSLERHILLLLHSINKSLATWNT